MQFVGRDGQFMFILNNLHDRYSESMSFSTFVTKVKGPVVRVTPRETHLDKPKWMEVLYGGSGSIRAMKRLVV